MSFVVLLESRALTIPPLSGLDESKFDPTTLVTLNSTIGGFWVAKLDGVTVNGVHITIESTQSIMDTGTTLLAVPMNDAAAIHHKIPGAIWQQDFGYYTVPCGTNASVALTFGGKEFAINPEDLAFASGGRTTGDCRSGIDAFTQDKFLVSIMVACSPACAHYSLKVGDTFLKSVYFSTNVDENTITLAKAI